MEKYVRLSDLEDYIHVGIDPCNTYSDMSYVRWDDIEKLARIVTFSPVEDVQDYITD